MNECRIILALLLCASVQALHAQSKDYSGAGIPTMQVAGTREVPHGFPSGIKVSRTVDREERDEAGGEWKVAEGVVKDDGTKELDLKKTAGKETVYTIRITDGASLRTLRIQVFDHGVRQSFWYRSDGNPDVRMYVSVPPVVDGRTRLMMVMTGRQRNADGYADSWIAWGSKNNYIVVTPYFDEKNWPEPNGYNFGNVIPNDERPFKQVPKAQWSFTLVEAAADFVRTRFGVTSDGFDLWGHSAGGQFVHRFMLFMPETKVKTVIAANPGWYTAPDTAVPFPYGLAGFPYPVDGKRLIDWTGRKIIIMRGTADIERTENLRQTPRADAQGQNRFERAMYMYNLVRKVNPKSEWEIHDVPGIKHEQKGMAVAAQKLLEERMRR